MGDNPNNPPVKPGCDPDFTTTNWSGVLAVADTAPARAFDALEKLCARHWFPIHVPNVYLK
jgi:hypothetical protein